MKKKIFWAFKNEKKNINRFYLKKIPQGYISIILYLKYLYYIYSYIL
jgi:archaellum component FlaD/FlaE